MNQQKTFRELLLEELEVPVKVTNPKDGQPANISTWRACVIAIKNRAIKGDIQSIMFIRSLTEDKGSHIDEESIHQEIERVVGELRHELVAAGLPESPNAELWLIAKQLLTLRRIATITAAPNHVDIVATPQKSGADKLELSTDNRIYNELLKQWRADWKDYKTNLVQTEMQKRMLK